MIQGCKTPRELIISLCLDLKGNWEEIYQCIVSKKNIEKIYHIEDYPFKCITILDEDYPEYLKRIRRPPFCLFYYGDISLIKNNDYKRLAIIGSRNCTSYGLEMTNKIIKGLDSSFLIVSGLARGIDRQAHKEALETNKKTIAVLASGIDYIYPKENEDIYKKIKECGLLVSETPFAIPPKPEQFVFRNRLISTFSDAVLITEAGERSGTLTTVGFALNEGKDIMCIPHLADSNSSCNRLIKEGAILVENAKDVIENLEKR